MTTSERLDRDLTQALTALASPAYPEYFDDALERATARRQRARWAFPERWLPMQVTAQRVAAAGFAGHRLAHDTRRRRTEIVRALALRHAGEAPDQHEHAEHYQDQAKGDGGHLPIDALPGGFFRKPPADVA